MIWAMIILMTLVIFASRYIFLEPKIPVRLGKNAQQFLSYSAPAVMTAIFAPLVFIRDGQLAISADNPYLISAIVAALLAWFTKNTLLTAVVSMVLFFMIH